MDQGSIYTCKNHPTLRWFDTKPGGALVFMGALEDGKLLPASFEPGSPLVRIGHYLNNRNPYNPSVALNKPFTFKDLKDYMSFVFRMEELGYTFECECPGKDLTVLKDETYESVNSHPKLTTERDKAAKSKEE